MTEALKQGNDVADLPKGSEMTALGPLPEEWRVARLGNVATFTRRPKGLVLKGRIAFIPMELIPSNGRRRPDYRLVRPDELRSGIYCEPGDIIIARITPCFENGKQAIIPDDLQVMCFTSTEVFPVKVNPRAIERDFLFYYLRLAQVRQQIAARMDGTTGRQRVPRQAFADLLLPLPPPREQRTIARVLHAVEVAMEATDRVMQATRELRKGLMCHLFTYGPVPLEEAERVPLKETETGFVPEHWEVVRLEEFVQKTRQVDPRKKPDWQFRYVDVSSVSSQTLRIHSYAVHSGANAPSRARRLVNDGDIIFATVRPSLKRIALVPSELDGHVCSTAFCVIRPTPQRADSTYVFFAVSNDHFVRRVSAHQRGSSYPAVADADVFRELVPLPPLPEQREITRVLGAVDKKLQAEETRRQALEALFKTLLHHLMTGRIRVNDVRLPGTREVEV